MNFSTNIKKQVDTHVVPPDEFLETVILTIKGMANDVFEPIEGVFEVYASCASELGESTDSLVRKAQMCEILRCLCAFESDYNWNEGADSTAGKETPEEEETGIAQVSANSMEFGNLRAFAATIGIKTTQDFIRLMKLKHSFAIEYTIQLLRITVKANGPVLHKHINGWLSKEAVEDFKLLLTDG